MILTPGRLRVWGFFYARDPGVQGIGSTKHAANRSACCENSGCF